MIYGFVIIAFSQSPWPVVSGVLLACTSLLSIFHNALTSALLQAPEALRGQVTAALTLSFGLSPIGALLLGQLAEVIGIANALSCGAVTCSLCIVLVMLRYRQLREL